jgi:monoamine oxidase
LFQVRSTSKGKAEVTLYGQVIVALPVGVLQDNPLLLPEQAVDVVEALAQIGPGRTAKVFARFDERWWAHGGYWHVSSPGPSMSSPHIGLWVDVSELAGAPVLCGFSVGDDALVLEQLTNPEVSELVSRSLTQIQDHLRHAPSSQASLGEPRSCGQDPAPLAGSTRDQRGGALDRNQWDGGLDADSVTTNTRPVLQPA